jgi:AraC-like DNA-binding protein
MTLIKGDIKVKVECLLDIGKKPMEISKHLELQYNTVKAFAAKRKLMETLPAKVKVKKWYFKGRICGIIRRYLEDYPTATLEQLKEACELKCSISYLCRYLNRSGLGRTKAKRNILLRDTNKAKRVEFAKAMLLKSDEQLKRILWSDETMVKSYPNGEAVFYRARKDLPDIVTPTVQQGGSGQMLWGCMSF